VLKEPTTATLSLLDVQGLLKPIPGDDPAGDALAYAHGLRDELVELRREERPEDFDEATRPPELKRADWQGVIRRASEALRQETKDLRVACHLIEALAKSEGFGGLRDGLTFLRRLIGECWDRLTPPMDEGDLEVRAAPLANLLDDPDRGIRFPDTVRMIPLIGPPDHRFGLIAWSRARQSHDPKVTEELARAVVQTPNEQIHATAEAIDQCLAELKLLIAVTDGRLGEESPGWTNLRAALQQCREMIGQELAGMVPDSRPEQAPAGNAAAASPVPTPPQAAVSRARAYAQLKQAAETLEKLEPHSPIPYLVKRAVQLGRLPFPKLMEQLIRDRNVLEEFSREFGLNRSAGEGPLAGR
jgi:type VI secretion system protein ImpA